MYCTKCGKPNDEDAHFCKFCGAGLTSSVAHGSSTTLRDPNRGPDLSQGESLSFADALYHVLDDVGFSLLHNPPRLLAYTADICDTDSTDYRVFEHNCDSELLAPVASLTSGAFGEEELNVAADRILLVLEDRSIEPQAAARVSTSMRNAIARVSSLPEIPIPTTMSDHGQSQFVNAGYNETDWNGPSADAGRVPQSTTYEPAPESSVSARMGSSSAQSWQTTQSPYPPSGPTPPPKRHTGLVALVVVLALLAAVMAVAAFARIDSNTAGSSQASSNGSESSSKTIENDEDDAASKDDSSKSSNTSKDGSTSKDSGTSKSSKDKNASSPSNGNDSSESATSAPASAPEPEPTPTPAESRADSFPRKWSGVYVGTSSYVQTEDHHINRAVAFNWTTVTESGHLEGVCYVGTEDSGPGETYGTCYVSGDVNWDTNEISFCGTEWIDQGGLGDLRQYSGTVDLGSKTMGGSAWDVGTGLYETPWNVSATDTISIMQNGSLTTV